MTDKGRPKKKAFLFAKIGVDLPDHDRLLSIPAGDQRGAAVGMWTAATCWSRKRMRDGFCPMEHLRGFGSDKTLNRLIAVGLLERTTDAAGVDGVMVTRYAEHNETKAELELKKEQTRLRVGEWREKQTRNVSGNALRNDSGNGVVPDSDSNSDLVGIGDPESAGADEPNLDSPAAAIRFAGAASWCDGVRSITGRPFPMPRQAAYVSLIEALQEGAKAVGCANGTEAMAFAKAEGAAYALQRAGKQISATWYAEWAASEIADRASGDRLVAAADPARSSMPDGTVEHRHNGIFKVVGGRWVPTEAATG